MSCLTFTPSDHTLTHGADTCMQWNPDIICAAVCRASAPVTSFPNPHHPVARPHMGTNKHKHAAINKHMPAHARSAVPNLSSLGLSIVVLFCHFSSWYPSIATIPCIHLSLWLRARRDELPVNRGLGTGIHNLFNALSISPHCRVADRPSKVSVRAPWPKHSQIQKAVNEEDKLSWRRHTDRQGASSFW